MVAVSTERGNVCFWSTEFVTSFRISVFKLKNKQKEGPPQVFIRNKMIIDLLHNYYKYIRVQLLMYVNRSEVDFLEVESVICLTITLLFLILNIDNFCISSCWSEWNKCNVNTFKVTKTLPLSVDNWPIINI